MNKFYGREMHFLKDFNGNPVAFDVKTSSVIYLNNLAQRILSFGPEIGKKEVFHHCADDFSKSAINKTIRELIDTGVLLKYPQKDDDLDMCNDDEAIIKGVSFNISHRCNMACGYCFGGGGCYGGPRVDMKKSIVEAGLDILFGTSDSSPRIVSFFGGEPFINWKVMRWTIEYAQSVANDRDIELMFFITTNGTLLDADKLNFLNNKNIKLVISVDGPPEIHNKERKFLDGRGSYDVVENNVRLILKEYPNISIQFRPTITSYSCGKIKDIYRHFRLLGVNKMHFRPESKYGERSGLTLEEYQLLGLELEELGVSMVDASDNGEYWGLVNILKFLNILYFSITRRDYCGAGASIISISPDGSIYPCPRFTGSKEFLLGNVKSGIKNKKRNILLDNSVDNRSDCNKCWARYICGGGCLYMHWIANGDYKKNDFMWCDWTRRSIETAIKVYARLQENDENDKMREFFVRHTPLLSDFGEGANELLTSILEERR